MRVRPPTLYFHAAPPPGGRLGPVSLGLPSRLGLLGDPAPTGLLVTPGLYDVIEVVALGPRAPAGRPGCGGRLLLGLAAAMRRVGRQLRGTGERRGALPQRRALPQRPIIKEPPSGRVTRGENPLERQPQPRLLSQVATEDPGVEDDDRQPDRFVLELEDSAGNGDHLHLASSFAAVVRQHGG